MYKSLKKRTRPRQLSSFAGRCPLSDDDDDDPVVPEQLHSSQDNGEVLLYNICEEQKKSPSSRQKGRGPPISIHPTTHMLLERKEASLNFDKFPGFSVD